MTYTAITAREFKEKKGSLAEKITGELSKINTEINASVKVAAGTLKSGAANAISFAWKNPEEGGILITSAVIDVTTAGGTALAVLDVGVGTTATATGDGLFDGIDINAIAVYKSTAAVKVPAGNFITGKILTKAATSLKGKFYITYTTV